MSYSMAARFTLSVIIGAVHVSKIAGNSPPAFTGSYPQEVSFAEGTPVGTELFTVTATDPEGVTPILSYTYVPADTSTLVTITEATSSGSRKAAVTLATGKELDYETQSTYKIYIDSFDGVAYSGPVLVTIQVTDVAETPALSPATTVQNFSIAESPTGTFIGHPAFNITDGDNFETHTWNITGGTGEPYINIYSTNGTALLMADFDLETAGTPTDVYVAIDIVDKDGLSVTVTYSLFVTDVNDNLPILNPTQYSFEVNQTSAIGTVLATMNASDADVSSPNNEITYSLDTSNAMTGYFNLSGGDLTLMYPIDIAYGSGPYVFYGYATDGGSPAYTATATFSITIPAATTTPTTTTIVPPAGYNWSASSGNVVLMIVACFAAACLIGYVLVLCWRWHTFGACLPGKCPTSEECNKCCECCHGDNEDEKITNMDDFGPTIISPTSKKGLEAMGKPSGNSIARF